MLSIFWPVLALGTVTVLLALASGLLGWYPGIMQIIAVSAGAAVMLLAVVLYSVQTTQRRTSERTLHDMEARISGIVESAMDAIISVDADQRIVLFNAASEKVFRRPRSAVLGQPLEMLIPARLRHAHRDHIGRFDATGVTSRRMGDKTVLVGLRADNEEFPIEASISQHSEDGRKYFTVILRDVTERVRADEALQRSREELREFATVASTVREQEKSRIARELHDELAQALTALKMDVLWVKERLPAGQEQLFAKFAAMQILLDSTVTATRRISADLRPLMLDDLGLIPAAEWLVQNFTQRHGIHCELAIDPPELELRDPHATAVFRILQESLTNVARHAHASLVQISLDGNDGEIMLRVRDNGRGFDPGGPRKPSSFGLVGLRERAYLLDGEIKFDTAPGKGTVIEVRIPLQQAPAP
jgi:PAS domain S-box-containing protein